MSKTFSVVAVAANPVTVRAALLPEFVTSSACPALTSPRVLAAAFALVRFMISMFSRLVGVTLESMMAFKVSIPPLPFS